MDQEVEEVSFLPGEAILNKKAVYEPSKGQRIRQVVCSRGWALFILLTMGAVMVAVALIAAFARPSSLASSSDSGSDCKGPSSSAAIEVNHEPEQTYVATNGEKFPWKNLRLPDTLLPEKYTIFLHTNLTLTHFSGRVQMWLRAQKDTDYVVFHASKLNISEIKVFLVEAAAGNDKKSSPDGAPTGSGELEVKKVLEYPINEQFYVKVGETILAGSVVKVQMNFSGSLESLSDMSGFYRSAYKVNGETRFMASTHFESSAARKAFPCLDEPQLKANFSMSMVRDQHHITLFNTPLKKSSTYQQDLVLDEYEESVRMSTYLVAYVVCDFKNISSRTNDGIQVRVFAPEDKIHMGKYALDAAVIVLQNYTKFFDIRYPLPKQDLIAIPNFAAGAMENWGLITYRDSAILYDPELSPESSKAWVATVVAHELAHQWFGNLVTMKWWNDLWLNEGFASYVENIGADAIDKDLHMMEEQILSFGDAQYLDGLATSHPIEVEVKNPDDAQSIFDNISYKKGSALIRMLRMFIGDKAFMSGLHRYLKEHEYGNAETKDLWDALQKDSDLPAGLTVPKVMDTWTKQMGYPVVTVTRTGGKLDLRQDRFLLWREEEGNVEYKEKTASPFGYKWKIPFTFTTSANMGDNQLVWITEEKASVNIPASASSADWVLGNVGTVGFYRVNYDTSNWKAIIQQSQKDHTVFSNSDRAGIISDAFSLARSGHLNYTIPLELSRYLVKETDYFVWSTAVAELGFLASMLTLEEEYDQLREFMLSLISPLVDRLGWDNKGDHIERKLRALIISEAMGFGHPSVVAEARRIFKLWIEDDTTSMNNDLRGTVYAGGVKYATKGEWDIVFERFLQQTIPSAKRSLLVSLSSSMEVRFLNILLEYSLDTSKIRSQDTDLVLESVSRHTNGHLVSWRFLKRNWDKLYARYADDSFILGGVVKSIVSGFTRQYDYDEVKSFFMSVQQGSAHRAVEQSLEVVQSHISWSLKNLDTVKAWLRLHHS